MGETALSCNGEDTSRCVEFVAGLGGGMGEFFGPLVTRKKVTLLRKSLC